MDKVRQIQQLSDAGLKDQAGLLASTLRQQGMRDLFRDLIRGIGM